MYKITNVEDLGQDYTVADTNGKILKTIQIISQDEIIDAAVGEYTDEFENFSNYLQKSVERMIGFESIDPNKVLWYATYDEEVALTDIIEYAINNGYDRVILEHLEDFENPNNLG